MAYKGDSFLMVLAITAVVVSLLAAGLTYLSVAQFSTILSGFATSTGQLNLTVESAAVINFTTNFINWGSGRVTEGQTSAQLTTLETNNVSNGNWTLQTAGGLRIENIGNVNVTLNLSAGKTPAQFIGGTNPGYQWNVTNLEAGSCLNASAGSGALNLSVFLDTTTTQFAFCRIFQFVNSNDSIRIDINLTIPYNSLTGALTDTITATAFEV